MRIENLDRQNRVIFVPDSKTTEGRRLVPMSGRVFEILEQMRCETGGLGISVKALRVRASTVMQSLPKSAQQSGPSERTGSLLCAT
jgi:hypothetical protein